MGKKNRQAKAEGTTGVAGTEQPKMASVRVCPCGCESALGKKRVFEQGHDARVRGWFVAVSEGDKELTTLPPVLQTAFPLWQANGAGAFVKQAVVAAQAN